jgi:hypothetical protein
MRGDAAACRRSSCGSSWPSHGHDVAADVDPIIAASLAVGDIPIIVAVVVVVVAVGPAEALLVAMAYPFLFKGFVIPLVVLLPP